MPVYTSRRSSTSASSFKANMGISKYLKDIPVPCKEQINKLEQSVFKTLPNSKNGPKRKEEETSLLSEPLRKQHNTTLNGVEKSLKNGSSSSKIHVQCSKLLEWLI